MRGILAKNRVTTVIFLKGERSGKYIRLIGLKPLTQCFVQTQNKSKK